MWVLTQRGELVNLDLCVHIQFVDSASDGRRVMAGTGGVRYELCRCDDEAHAKRIIQELATTMARRTNKNVFYMDFVATAAREEG